VARSFSDANTKKELKNLSNDLIDTRENFENLYSLFGLVAEARGARPKRAYVRDKLDKLVRGARFSTDGAGIDVDIVCDRDVKSPRMIESEFLSILVNLYSNAIKSTIANSGRRIQINARGEQDTLILEFLDTGVGLPQQHHDEVVKPFVSDPAGSIYRKLEAKVADTVVSSLGRGTGLGLSIVTGILDKYHGALSFYFPEGWSVGVQVRIPKGGR